MFDSPLFPSFPADAADLLRANNGWLVISAGNDGNNGESNKIDYQNIIFVGSTTSSDNRSGFSSYGNYVDIAAPGSSILLTTDGGGYQYWQGTSMAAPLAAATLNLLYSVDPTLTSDESFNILKNSAVDLGDPGWDIEFGHGRIDAHAAVLAASNNLESAVGTPPNFKVAFIADQGYYEDDAELVLQLIANEGTDMVLHQGDFDYNQNPTDWDNMITTELGSDFPYFASVGNHDLEEGQWPNYQQKLQERLDRIIGADCTGDLGNKSSCHYQGLFFILSGVGAIGSGTSGSDLSDHLSYIQNELAQDDSIWSLCTWHKNHQQMQVGGKDTEVSMEIYDACREGGAIIATGHEHSYSRTKTLTSFAGQTVDPAWSDPGEVRVADGATFSFVSGLGGKSVRDQSRCLDDPTPYDYPYGCNGVWASIYSSSQDSRLLSGALFCEFNHNGQEDKASCYFKNTLGETIDSFNITSFMGVDIPQEPPVSYDQLVSTFENSPKDITLVATDTNGDTLTFSIVSGPSNGILSGTAPDLTYTPNSDYTGSDSFTFKANDGTDDSNTATVFITVDPVNNPPIAGISNYNTAEDTLLQVPAPGVLGNATDTDGDTLTAVLDADVANGSLSLNADGSFSYTPDANFNGADFFTYHANDGTDDSNTATVSITIDAVNDAPTADAGGPYNAILGNSIVFDGSGSFDLDGDLITFFWDFGDGNTSTDANPSHTYGSGGTFPVTLVVNDGNLNSPVSNTSADISLPNNPPVANNQTVPLVGSSVVVTLTGYDLDDDSLSFSIVSNPSDGRVSKKITTISPTEAEVTYNAKRNFSGSDSFTFLVNDGTDNSNVATIIIEESTVNSPPVAVDDNVNVQKGSSIIIDVVDNDSDDGTLDLASITITQAPSNELSLVDNGDGTLTYTHDGTDTISDSFKYTINDNEGETSNEATVSITITEPVPATFVHVESLVGSSSSKGPWTTFTVTISVHDHDDPAAQHSGVLVSGDWNGGAESDSCTTTSGSCSVSYRIKNSGPVTFDVTDLSGTGFEYGPGSLLLIL